MKKGMLKGLQQLAGTVALAALVTHVQADGPASGNVGGDAPVFSAQTLSGQTFNLADYKGNKPVYLKFWATWCSYCKAEMPHLNSIKERYGDDIQVVTINVGMNDSVDNINHFFDGQGYRIPTIFDARGELTQRYGVVGTPHHVLIDEQGRIAYRTFLATDQLDQQIQDWSLERQAQNPAFSPVRQSGSAHSFRSLLAQGASK